MTHSTAGLRRARMSLQVALPVQISSGEGKLQFPIVFKREALTANIACLSLSFKDNEDAKNESLFVVCSSSSYRNQDYHSKNNILAMFQNQKNANIVSFDHYLPLTTPEYEITIEIVDFNGKRQDVSAAAVFCIDGLVKNRLLTI